MEEFCGELLGKTEYVAAVDNDIPRECQHGFGHATFYVLATRQLKQPISVRRQMRKSAGFFLRNETVCEGYKICSSAPDKDTLRTCHGGMKHSMNLFGNGDSPKLDELCSS